jgi:glucuronate isomerase
MSEMNSEFITEDFLLHNKAAKHLYHEYASEIPIYDYHNHLSADRIADDIQFENITRVWLAEDHYKWRLMRANGIEEKYITGSAPDFVKFQKWSQTIPYCLSNPVYHWTGLELKRYFGIDKLLSPGTAEEIYNICNEMLKTQEFSSRNLLRRSKVKLVCGVEQPLSSLEHYQKVKRDGFEVKVYTSFLTDKTFMFDSILDLNSWIDQLAESCDIDINSFSSYIEAIRKRHKYFHQNGCRISDRGIPTIYAEGYTKKEIQEIFQKIRLGQELNELERLQFKSAVMHENALMDAEAGWVQQFHLGVIRSNRTAMLRCFGVDAGCDSMADMEIARPMANFFDRLDKAGKLPRTIIYNLNPAVSEVVVTMLGNFQDGSCPGKMQYGPAWWFLDQKDGIEKHLSVLSNLTMLSRFIGMVTDSRSFLSFPRHEYFRRILCNFLGGQVEEGLLPNDMELLGKIVKDICFNNARSYFPMELD